MLFIRELLQLRHMHAYTCAHYWTYCNTSAAEVDQACSKTVAVVDIYYYATQIYYTIAQTV